MKLVHATLVLSLAGCSSAAGPAAPATAQPSQEPASSCAAEKSTDAAAATQAPVGEADPAATAGAPDSSVEPDVSQPGPLEELSALGEEVLAGGPDVGGSIRAKREPPPDAVRASPQRLRARVEGIARGRFPLAAVRVKILTPPAEGAAAGLKKNDMVVVLPRLVTDRGRVLFRDPSTTRNAGAYYLSKGDRVHLRLEAEHQPGVWWAAAIARD